MTDNMITVFEKIKKTNQYQQEFWSARELGEVLEYSEYRHFIPAIKKAQKSCKNADQSIKNHFEDILDMIEIGKTASRQIKKRKHPRRSTRQSNSL